MRTRTSRGENELKLATAAPAAKPAANTASDTPASAAGVTPIRLLRIKEVAFMTGLSRMTIYRLERAGTFPRRRRLGIHAVAWLEHDVSHWVSTLPVSSLPETGETVAFAQVVRRTRA